MHGIEHRVGQSVDTGLNMGVKMPARAAPSLIDSLSSPMNPNQIVEIVAVLGARVQRHGTHESHYWTGRGSVQALKERLGVYDRPMVAGSKSTEDRASTRRDVAPRRCWHNLAPVAGWLVHASNERQQPRNGLLETPVLNTRLLEAASSALN